MIQSNFLTNNSSVLDQVVSIYGSLNYVYDFLSLNTNFALLSDIPAGNTIFYDLSVITQTNSIAQNNFSPSTQPNTVSVQGIYNQSIFDLIIRYYGGLENISEFLSDNSNIVSITEPAIGNYYLVSPLYNNLNVNQFNTSENIFATYIDLQEENLNGRAFDNSWNISFH